MIKDNTPRKKKIKRAIVAHFACNKVNLLCDRRLEDSIDAAKSFYYHLTDTKILRDVFYELIDKNQRYKNKLLMIKRYIKNEK